METNTNDFADQNSKSEPQTAANTGRDERSFDQKGTSKRKSWMQELKNNLSIKAGMIAFLTLLLLIPGGYIHNLINERSSRQVEVETEISDKWAHGQEVAGPFLIIPYRDRQVNTEGAYITLMKKCYILPANLNISGVMQPEERHRSIFKTIVYQSDLTLHGDFEPLNFDELGINPEDMDFSKAQIFFEISDFKGIGEQLMLQWDGEVHELVVADMSNQNYSKKGLSTSINLTPADLQEKHKFSLSLKLKGSKTLSFIPLGKSTTANIKSEWETPSYFGNFLPEQKGKYGKNGFEAQWKIFYVNRDYPQLWKDHFSTSSSAFGVELLKSIDSYSKVKRSVKYELLFVALTFALFFLVEILQKKKIHLLQYILVGFALIMFFVLLLSISEYLGFNWAYLIAAIATISLVLFYTKNAFGKWSVGLTFGSVLSGLYAFIYVLIQLEDTALLVGSIGLFILLALIMYFTRKVDWHDSSND